LAFNPKHLLKKDIETGLISFLILPLDGGPVLIRRGSYSECRSIGFGLEVYDDFLANRAEFLPGIIGVPAEYNETIVDFLHRLSNQQVDLLFLLCSQAATGNPRLQRKLYISLLDLARGSYLQEIVKSRLIKFLADSFTVDLPVGGGAAAAAAATDLQVMVEFLNGFEDPETVERFKRCAKETID
jgi:hypothetical protein